MATRVIRRPARFSGTVRVPSDKSLTHRAVLFAALSEGVSTIINPLEAADCKSTLACVEALGCRVQRESDRWHVDGAGLWGLKAPKAPLNCGNSGTTMRLLSGILAAQNFASVLIGDESLSSRPMQRIADPLREMGATVGLTDGKHAPVAIAGTKGLHPIHYFNALSSAQVKSCILLAGMHIKGQTIVEEPNLSRDHTERMLAACGADIQRVGATVMLRGPVHLRGREWVIPSDISSAAFFLVGGLLLPGADVTLTSINTNPTRTGLLDVLKASGAAIDILDEKEVGGEPVATLRVKKQKPLSALRIGRDISPRLIDEIPVLAVAATQAQGRSIFSGLEELRHKETDRIDAIHKNLTAMGADVSALPDGLIINGPTPLKGATVQSFDDHRIAMSMAIAGLISDGETKIEGSEAVAISFPEFWTHLETLQR